jgi:tetratricopeptide (TPR) repeat protein
MTGSPSPPKAPVATGRLDQRGPVAALCLLLVAITFAVFGQTAHFGFVNFDDDLYVYANARVTCALTWKGLLWAWMHPVCYFYHPLTMLSLMVDYQLHGLHAGGYHLTNVLLHAASAVLLFLVLRRMSGALWRSAFVAAVFAIHPLRVESVAWISERKDVLSGLFFMLTLGAYARYVRQPSRRRYAAVALAYALGLLSKNMLVTLPMVLLLLDWWPLQRFKLDGAGGGKAALFWRLVKEKIPLFLLSIASCVATALVPVKIPESVRVPLFGRIGNALVSYVIYLRQMVCPARLAIPYLYPPNGLPFWMVGLAFVLLAAISITVWACRERRPYLLMGWLWYLGMLLPVAGFIQISYHARADRYTYLPAIGLALAATWAVGDWSRRWKLPRAVLGGLMAALIAALMICSWKQTGYWKDTETLWTHTLACAPGNHTALSKLGLLLCQQGRLDEAVAHYQNGLQIYPDDAEIHADLGNALLQQGNVDQAIAHYLMALKVMPDFAEAHYNLGNALVQKDRFSEAVTQFQVALRFNPTNADAHINLGNVLFKLGRVDEAIAHYQNALQIKPDFVPVRLNLGNALLQVGKPDQALAHLQQALDANPNNAGLRLSLGLCLLQLGRMQDALSQYQNALQIEPANPALQNNLAWLLATSPEASLRDGNRAVELARQANALTSGQNPAFLTTLAAAFAEAGRFPEAVETAQRALSLAGAQSDTMLAAMLQSELKLYQAGAPFHTEPPH